MKRWNLNERKQRIIKNSVEAADNKRAEDIIALDVQNISLLADYFVIMQADSDRQVKAIAENIEEQAEEKGYDVLDVEGKSGANWVLIDLGDVVAHVFKTETRKFYNLEKLWADADDVDISAWIK